jgi:ATP-dependent exoDNAse (exonuclease V) beta subunit
VRRQELIVKEAQRGIVEARRRAYDSWRAARNGARQHGATASLAVRTVGSWAQDALVEPLIVAPDAVSVVTVDPAAAMPHAGGARFGLLLHAVLAQASFDADIDALRALAATEGRALGAGEEEIAMAARSAARVLAHDLLDRARRAAARGVCRREIPVTLTLADGTLLEGVIDLAFEEHGCWTIVDYKTDRELLAAGEARYRRQVACYASAVAQATGGPATGVLIRI